MHVIGHDHPFVQFDVREMIGNLQQQVAAVRPASFKTILPPTMVPNK